MSKKINHSDQGEQSLSPGEALRNRARGARYEAMLSLGAGGSLFTICMFAVLLDKAPNGDAKAIAGGLVAGGIGTIAAAASFHRATTLEIEAIPHITAQLLSEQLEAATPVTTDIFANAPQPDIS